ncbi:Localization factor PodJL [compost metagenome]
MYHNGKGVQRDLRQAAAWFRKAAEQGDSSAQLNLGAMYAVGQGVVQDHKLAYVWFSVAAANGYTLAMGPRDEVAQELTPASLAEAQALAAKYFEKYQPKN